MKNERIFEALDGLTTPDPSPDLYARIRDRIDASGPAPVGVAPLRMAAAVAGLALLTALNVGVAVAAARPGSTSTAGDPYASDLASDYTLYEP